MAHVLGLDGKAYRNTSVWATPVWDEITNLTNVTLNLEKATADVTTRGGGGFRQTVGTLKDGTVESEMIYDTADADFTEVQTNFFSNTPMDLAFMDGDIAVPGQQGLRALFDVTNFSRDEQLEDAMRVPVTFRVTIGQTPYWLTTT